MQGNIQNGVDLFEIFVTILYDNTKVVIKKPVLLYAKNKDAISHSSQCLCYSPPEKYETICFVSCLYLSRVI